MRGRLQKQKQVWFSREDILAKELVWDHRIVRLERISGGLWSNLLLTAASCFQAGHLQPWRWYNLLRQPAPLLDLLCIQVYLLEPLKRIPFCGCSGKIGHQVMLISHENMHNGNDNSCFVCDQHFCHLVQ